MNIFQRFLSWFLSYFKKLKIEEKDDIQKEKIPDNCQFENCTNKLFITNYKKCKYCGRYFCSMHIAPAEKHNCKGNLKSLSHSYRTIYSKGRTTVISK